MYVCITADIERFSDGASKYGCSYTVDDVVVTRKLLDLFADADVISTLFILGRYTHENPVLTDILTENGHELASHGYSHIDLRGLPYPLLEEELSKSKLSTHVKGFRAPYYSFDKRMIEYLDHHFMYDSSTIPGRTRGLLFQRIRMLTESLMEIPISTAGFLPLTSMGLRYLPEPVLKRIAFLILKKAAYLIINVHPWEFHKIPHEVNVPFYVKKNTGPHFFKKFSAFIQFLKRLDVEFVTMEQVYEQKRS
jgi:peptidoglycan/xylan/chitin deacetylase (PgdA/CDA1 family)